MAIWTAMTRSRSHLGFSTLGVVGCLTIAGLFAGCLGGSDTAVEPSGPEGTLFYSEGSIPPPGHYEFTLEITGAQYTFTYGDYDGPVGEITGEVVDLDGARAALLGAGFENRPDGDAGCDSGPNGIGGAHGYVKIELAGEPLRASTEDCDSNKAEADGILEAIKAVVGEDVVATATYEITGRD